MNRRTILASVVAAPVATLPIPAYARMTPGTRDMLKSLLAVWQDAPRHSLMNLFVQTPEKDSPWLTQLSDMGYFEFVEERQGSDGYSYSWGITEKFLIDFPRNSLTSLKTERITAS